MPSRRKFIENSLLLTGATLLADLPLLASYHEADDKVPLALQKEMYEKALLICKQKIRGGPNHPVFKKPFVDAAFSSSIFYWDTCFIATYAKYHQDELPIINALDNFYDRMDPDGFICREFTAEGKAFWPKTHPVSLNPPLLAFAELELFSISKDLKRLQLVYPMLKKHFEFWINNYQAKDKLFFSDSLGSGMDNIPRYPYGWEDDGKGIPMNNLHPDLFNYDGIDSKWNQQGRSVDASAQMCLFADNLSSIAKYLGNAADLPYFNQFHEEVKNAINEYCWNEEDGFYYDLGYGQQIKRKHIGMFWTLIGGVVPPKKLKVFLAHLTNPNEFWTTIPIATYAADQKEYQAHGGYWLGSVWAPTNYMVLKGLERYHKHALAKKLAKKYYKAVADVYVKTGTFWENYAPGFIEKGNESRKDFCGWTGLVPIAVWKEYIQ